MTLVQTVTFADLDCRIRTADCEMRRCGEQTGKFVDLTCRPSDSNTWGDGTEMEEMEKRGTNSMFQNASRGKAEC